jgi:hypothetical protein
LLSTVKVEAHEQIAYDDMAQLEMVVHSRKLSFTVPTYVILVESLSSDPVPAPHSPKAKLDSPFFANAMRQ